MKYLVAFVLLLLLVINSWLLFKQMRIEHRLESLQAENQKLVDEMAQKPAISPEDFRKAQAQLDKAHTYLEAVENRLTNATSILDTLRQAAAAQNQQARVRLPTGQAAPFGNAVPADRANINPA